MNGPHDLGGRMGFGPAAPERDEPYFHAAWEKRALGVTDHRAAPGASEAAVESSGYLPRTT